MTHRLWLVCAVAGAQLACGSPYDKALDRGIEAERAGDLHGAARAYREACAARPEKKDICRRAEIIADAAVKADVRRATPLCRAGNVTACKAALADAEALVPNHPAVVALYTETGKRFLGQAEAACAKNDVDGCLTALAPARDLLPPSPRLQATIDRSGALYADRCASRQLTSPDDAVALVACLEALTSHTGTAAYQARVAKEATRASVAFAGVRDDGWQKQLVGASFVIDSAVSCFAPNDVSMRRTQASRAGFLAASTIPFVLETTGAQAFPDPATACATVAHAIGPAVTCTPAPAAQPPPITLGINLSVGRVVHNVDTTSYSVRYQSGTRTLPNPAYRPAARRLRDAEDALRQAEDEASRLEGECNAAKSSLSSASHCYDCTERSDKDRVCSEYDSAENLADRREDDVDSARRDLNNTPEYLHEAIYSDHQVIEEHHSWQMNVAIEWRLGQNAPHVLRSAPTYTDTVRAAFEPAGVTGDGLQSPPDGYFHRDVQKRFVSAAADITLHEAKRRASARAGACQGRPRWTGDWLECWAESTLWSGSVPSTPSLLQRRGDEAAQVTCLKP